MKAHSRMIDPPSQNKKIKKKNKPQRNHKGPSYTPEQIQLFNEVYRPRTSKSKYSGSNQRHAKKQENMTYNWKKNESIGTDPGITRTGIDTDNKAVLRPIFKNILKNREENIK